MMAHTEPVKVLTVAVQSGPSANVNRVLRQRELPWSAGVDESGQATRAFDFKVVPAFVVVDADGHLRAPTLGYTTEIGMRLRLWWVSVSSWRHESDRWLTEPVPVLGRR